MARGEKAEAEAGGGAGSSPSQRQREAPPSTTKPGRGGLGSANLEEPPDLPKCPLPGPCCPL